jgi:hypothetical protein
MFVANFALTDSRYPGQVAGHSGTRILYYSKLVSSLVAVTRDLRKNLKFCHMSELNILLEICLIQ